jgi:hypothetical protein
MRFPSSTRWDESVMSKRLVSSLLFATVALLGAGSANANLIVNPAAGLIDFVFSFSGVGSSATWSGEDKLEVTVAAPTVFSLHSEDCCVVGDSWALEIDGVIVPWGAIGSGDGNPNGGAFFGAPGNYFESLSTVVFGPGTHTIDLIQLTGIPGGSYFNMSAGKVPVPGTLLLVACALLGLGAVRRRTA